MKTIITMFRDKRGKWRWHAKRAGRIVAESGESYSARGKCKRSLTRFIDSLVALEFTLVDLWRDSR